MYPYWPYWENSYRLAGSVDRNRGSLSLDDLLARRVAGRLLQAPLVDHGHLVVDVQNGVVILAGALSSQEACDAASRQAWDTPGVRDVSNQLTVSPRRRRRDGTS